MCACVVFSAVVFHTVGADDGQMTLCQDPCGGQRFHRSASPMVFAGKRRSGMAIIIIIITMIILLFIIIINRSSISGRTSVVI